MPIAPAADGLNDVASIQAKIAELQKRLLVAHEAAAQSAAEAQLEQSKKDRAARGEKVWQAGVDYGPQGQPLSEAYRKAVGAASALAQPGQTLAQHLSSGGTEGVSTALSAAPVAQSNMDERRKNGLSAFGTDQGETEARRLQQTLSRRLTTAQRGF